MIIIVTCKIKLFIYINVFSNLVNYSYSNILFRIYNMEKYQNQNKTKQAATCDFKLKNQSV